MDGSALPTPSRTCPRCGTPFQPKVISLFGAEIAQPTCDSCADQADAEWEQHRAANLLREREARWAEICPPLYAASDLARLPQAGLDAINSWRDAGDGKALAIRGPSGRCKTRLLFMLGKRLFLDGNSVEAISGIGLARLAAERHSNDAQTQATARDRFRRVTACKYLLLDDLGKQRFTEAVEVDFADLIEMRTSHLRPTFWTANCTGDEFEQMLSRDRGEPIIRRLAEFSRIIVL